MGYAGLKRSLVCGHAPEAAPADQRAAGARATLARIAPALGLFFLSPLIGEFLLGNMAIDALPALIVLAPLYGGGALVIREVTRRTGRGWPTIFLLALAYAIVEEGLVTQSLFNPNYAGADLLSVTFVPALGIGIWWTLFVLTLHAVWSICVPIAIVESFVPGRSTHPWLGNVGLAVASLLLALGAIATFFGTYTAFPFVASTGQLLGSVVIIVLLAIAAFAFTGRPRPPARGVAPHPWLAGAFSFVVSSLFMLATMALDRVSGWVVVSLYLIVYGAVLGILLTWSRRRGWSQMHILALAGGALLTYAWHAFPRWPVIGSTGRVDLVGNIVFAVGALVLLAAAVAVQRSSAVNAAA
jgi:hypothetical protein